MVGEGQPLDVIVKIVAQPARDSFRGLRRQPAHTKGEQTLKQRQAEDSGRHPRYLPLTVGTCQYIVHKVAQQVENRGAAERCQSRGHDCEKIDLTKAGRHSPQTDKAVGC